MRIAHYLLAEVVFASLAAPRLRPTEEHTLITRASVEHRRRMPEKRTVISLQGHVKAAQVGDVLTQGKFPIDMCARHRFICGILCRELFCAQIKFCGIAGSPPVAKFPFGVQLSTFIV